MWGIRPTDSTPGMLPAHAVGVGNNPAASDALVNPAGVVLATPVSQSLSLSLRVSVSLSTHNDTLCNSLLYVEFSHNYYHKNCESIITLW